MTRQIGNSHKELQGGWDNLVSQSRERALGTDVPTIFKILTALNTQTANTGYGFHIQPVVDGVIPPNVAPYYQLGQEFVQPIKVEKTGPVIEALLQQLPDSVRTGQDEQFRVHQIRLDDYSSWEHMMGTTTLLMVFLEDTLIADGCFFFPGDDNSVKNWEVIKDLYAASAPQLGP